MLTFGLALLALGLTVVFRFGLRRLSFLAVRRGATFGNWLLTICTVLALGLGACLWFACSPFFGLGGLILVPAMVRLGQRRRHRTKQRQMEKAALAFFHSLLGLNQVGLSLPAALFQLTQKFRAENSFAEALSRHLERYREGKSLSLCLGRFRATADLPRAGLCLSMLEMAYSQGLPVGPFLARLLATAELEAWTEDKLRGLKHSAAGQAAFAFFIPWILGATVYAFQPDFFASLVSDGRLVGLALGCLLLESLGIWLVWQYSVFH